MPQKHQHLMLGLSLILGIGFLATSLASFFVSKASLREQLAQRELPLTSDTIYSEIQRDLIGPISISSFMATDTFLRDWVLDGEADVDSVSKYLGAIKDKYGTFTTFFVSDRTRNYYYPGGILKQVHPDEERDIWYFRVREMAPEYEINVDPDMANRDAMTIFINCRVFDYEGNYIGVTGVGLAVFAVKALIEEYERTYERRVYFVTSQGEVTLHGAGFPPDATRLSDIPGLAEIAEKALSGQERRLRYRRDGKTIHLNTRFISEFGWFLMVEQSEERLLRSVFTALMANLGICAAAMGIALLLTKRTLTAYQRYIETLVATDKLTGAYNRRAFDMLSREATRNAERTKGPLSCIVLDIDHFKQVNDRYGHVAGDSVLRAVVTVLKQTVRKADPVCRWGGEEFFVLLAECSLENAFAVAEKIRHGLSKMATRHEGQDIGVTASFGVAEHRQGEAEEEMFRRADRALYRAKQNGRNRTEKESPPGAPADALPGDNGQKA